MQFKVIRPFNWLGSVRKPGQVVEMTTVQAGRLRSMGLVGNAGPELAVKRPAEKAIETRPERAVKEPQERRAHRKKAPQEHRTRKEKVKDEVDADNAAGY